MDRKAKYELDLGKQCKECLGTFIVLKSENLYDGICDIHFLYELGFFSEVCLQKERVKTSHEYVFTSSHAGIF